MRTKTVLVLTLALGLLMGIGAPTAASDPEGGSPVGPSVDCAYIDPWGSTPHVEISPDDCLPD